MEGWVERQKETGRDEKGKGKGRTRKRRGEKWAVRHLRRKRDDANILVQRRPRDRTTDESQAYGTVQLACARKDSGRASGRKASLRLLCSTRRRGCTSAKWTGRCPWP